MRSRELFRILVGGPVPDGSSSRSPRVMYFLSASVETALPATGEPAPDDLGDIPFELLAMLGEPDDDPDEAAAQLHNSGVFKIRGSDPTCRSGPRRFSPLGGKRLSQSEPT